MIDLWVYAYVLGICLGYLLGNQINRLFVKRELNDVIELSPEELEHIIRCVEESCYRTSPREYDYRVECRALLKKLSTI